MKYGEMNKSWNIAPLATNTNIFGNTSSWPVNGGNKNSRIDLNKCYIILTLNVNGLGANTYSINKPAVNWLQQFAATFNFIDGDTVMPVPYTGYVKRGLAAYILEILEYTTPKYANMTLPEILTPLTGQTKTTFDVCLPMKWICDAAYDTTMLNIDSMIFNPSWLGVNEIFTLPVGASVVLQTANLLYSTWLTTPEAEAVLLTECPRLCEIPNRSTYAQTMDVAIGATQTGLTLTPNFPTDAFIYCFTTDSPAGGGATVFNPNPLSVVTTHSLSCFGKVFPATATYNATLSPTVETGLLRHYLELITIAGKDNPDKDNILSYTDWRDNHRFYAIELGVPQSAGGVYNFQAQLSAPTVNPSVCYGFFVGNDPLIGKR